MAVIVATVAAAATAGAGAGVAGSVMGVAMVIVVVAAVMAVSVARWKRRVTAVVAVTAAAAAATATATTAAGGPAVSALSGTVAALSFIFHHYCIIVSFPTSSPVVYCPSAATAVHLVTLSFFLSLTCVIVGKKGVFELAYFLF